MACPACGFPVTADFAFCPKCGSRQPAACPGCGFACPPEFAFCPRCGTRLGAAPAAGAGPGPAGPAAMAARAGGEEAAAAARPVPGEAAEADRRGVTVLFADVAGFTAMSERADPEDVRSFQNEFFAAMAAVIQRYGGFVEKFVGDAVLAVFGAPVAHEDDAERALRAALDMHRDMAGLDQRWQPRFGAALALHVGVNTGPVVAGAVAGGAYAVTGDTVNTAARLQAAAGPGQTLVGEATQRLAAHAFDFEAAEPLAVRGKREPVAVHRLRGPRARRLSPRGLAAWGLAAPLVGRDPELEQLLAAFARARRGVAQVVSLVGEAGAGKSRLLAEFLARLEREAAGERLTLRRMACSSLGEQTYGVLTAFLREAYGVSPDDGPAVAQARVTAGLREAGLEEAEVAAIAPVLAWVQGFEAGDLMRHAEPEQLKRQTFLAVRRLVERRLERGPVVLVVEDLHWADAASVEVLRFVVERLSAARLMLVVTHRPDVDPALLVTPRTASTVIRLAPLAAAESERILAAFFGPGLAGMPAELRRLIVERAGGNPLYLEEIVRGLIAAGVLRRDGDGWQCVAPEAVPEVPSTLQGLLLSRIDRLPSDARRLLQEAAVLGVVVDPALLRAVSALGSRLPQALQALEEAELLAEGPAADGGRCYRFSHALVQDVVYQSLLAARRTELHGRAGRVLEELAGGRTLRREDVEALGHHWSLSAERARGARYLRMAGDLARALYANEDARRHYTRALDALAGAADDGAETALVRERLGDLLGLVGERERAREHYEAVGAAAGPDGDRRRQARMLRKLGGLLWDAGEREAALARFAAALELLGPAPGTQPPREWDIEVAHLYQEMGRLAFRSGDSARAIEWARQALERAERVLAERPDLAEEERAEAATVVAHCWNTLGVARARQGEHERAVASIERSVEVAQAHGLLRAACRGYTNLGVLYSTVDPRRGIETCLTGLETARKIGDLGFQSWLYANLAVAYCALTDRCEAEGIEAARHAIELDRQLGQLDHLAVPLIVLGQIYQCQGASQRALEYYGEALALAERVGEPQLLFPCYDGLATLYLELGDDARAEAYMARAREVCARAGVDPDALTVLPFLG